MNVTIVGAGYVGLVTAVGLARVGHTVTCVDRDKGRIEAIAAGRAPFHEPGLDRLLKKQLEALRLRATTNLQLALRGSQVSIIAVGTPSTDAGIDLRFIREAAREIGTELRQLEPYHVVVVKSTVVPSTTDSVVRGELEAASGMVAGIDFGLAVNPEFLSEGRAVADFIWPDRIVIGAACARARSTMAEMYARFGCPVVHTTPRNAEMIKYAANALQATLISFSNEIASICESVSGLDEETVMQGVHLDRCWSAPQRDRSIFAGAVSYLRAGMGFGGSCFPKDLRALRAFAHGEGVEVPILESVLRVNEERATRVVNLLVDSMGTVGGKRIAVLGLAFKPETSDVRESPGIRIARLLLKRGGKVVVHDPMVTMDTARAELGPSIRYVPSVPAAAAGADAMIIATGWDAYRSIDWAQVAPLMRSPVVFDGRQVVTATHAVANGVKLLSTGRCSERPALGRDKVGSRVDMKGDAHVVQ